MYFRISSDGEDSQRCIGSRVFQVCIAVLGGSLLVVFSIMVISTYSSASSSTSTPQAATSLLGMPSSLRTPSHVVPQTLASRLPGASPWKELALAGMQDANRCGRDVSMNANAVKSVLASMDSKSRAFVARAADEAAESAEEVVKEVETKETPEASKSKINPEAILKGVGATGPLGFWDPAGFSTDVSEGRLLFFREVELKHGRVCMLASLGILTAETFHPLFPQVGDLPAYIQFQSTPLQQFWVAVAVLIAIPELGSWKSFKQLDSGDFEMESDRMPGDLGFDPLGLKPSQEKDLQALQNKEINNGRLAMIATAGMIGQELATSQKLFR